MSNESLIALLDDILMEMTFHHWKKADPCDGTIAGRRRLVFDRTQSMLAEMRQCENHITNAKAHEPIRKMPCCGYTGSKDLGPIYWNEYNKVVQCHNCGQIFSMPEQSSEIKPMGDASTRKDEERRALAGGKHDSQESSVTHSSPETQAGASPQTLNQAIKAVQRTWRTADKISASEADTERMIAEAVIEVMEGLPEKNPTGLAGYVPEGNSSANSSEIRENDAYEKGYEDGFGGWLAKIQGFDEWCASVTDCGHVVQPNSATARQRKLGWDAAMRLMRELSCPKCHGKLDGDEYGGCKPNDCFFDSDDEKEIPHGVPFDWKVIFEECPVGHGNLRAVNWVKQPECAYCKIKALKDAIGAILYHDERGQCQGYMEAMLHAKTLIEDETGK